MPKKNFYYRSKKVLDLVNAYKAIGEEEKEKLEEAGKAIKENTVRVTLLIDGDKFFYVRATEFLKWKKPLNTLSDSDTLILNFFDPRRDSKHKLIKIDKDSLCSYGEFRNHMNKYLAKITRPMKRELAGGNAYIMDNAHVKIGNGYLDFFVTKAEASAIATLKKEDFEDEPTMPGRGTLGFSFLKDITHKKSSSLTPEEHASLMGIYADLGAILG